MIIYKNKNQSRAARWLILTAALAMIGSIAIASPPHPDLLEKIKDGRIIAPYFLDNLSKMRSKGIGSGDRSRIRSDGGGKGSPTSSTVITGSYRILALLVDFSDNTSSIPSAFLDTMLFDSLGNSVRNYYGEVSYGQIDLITVNLPSSVGWQRAPQTYAYYVNNANGTGSYPQNSQKLVEDLVDLVDSLVDFSVYDNDGDGDVDALMVIHSGSGAEFSGQNTDIWSHKWAISPRSKDGVNVTTYAIQPEYWNAPGDLTIGVYVHELGHAIFDLPDLYDTDYSSYGIGRWGLMGYGSWLGPSSDGSSPSHPSAWSRIAMGYATAITVGGNINGQVIAPVEQSGDIFRLWNAGAGSGDEYFLIENRQKLGYDSYLMGEGLLIWHIDEAKSDNTEEWWQGLDGRSAHFKIGLVPADGAFEIAQKIDQGDAADPFPGTGSKTSFSSLTLPNSNSYAGTNTSVAVTGITVSGDSITANLIVGLAADIGGGGDGGELLKPSSIKLHQNYPNPFNPQTTLSFSTDNGGQITIDVFNTLGRKVKRILEANLPPGNHTVIWDTKDESGHQVSSGIYLYRLQVGDESSAKKMVLIR